MKRWYVVVVQVRSYEVDAVDEVDALHRLDMDATGRATFTPSENATEVGRPRFVFKACPMADDARETK